MARLQPSLSIMTNFRNSLAIPVDAPVFHPLMIPTDSTALSPARTIPRLDRDAAAAARQAKREHWATLTLRQEWADEAHMRTHLKAAGIQVANNTEPASAHRMGLLLKRAGIYTAEVRECLGTTLDGFLEKNPNLPLWAAVALAVESTGRFHA